MDPRIEEFIRANRRRYTREAITKQLEEAGHDRAAIDATWTALETKDPDAVAGEGFWGRFWLYLMGINVAVFLLVLLATGMIGALGQGSFVLAIVLAIVLVIGALIAWGIVAATQPTRLGRGTAMAIGVIIPLLFAFLIGGSCYALVGAIGPPPPPPLEGTMELRTDAPLEFEGSGAAFCQVQADGSGFSVFAQESGLGTVGGRLVQASVDSFSGVVDGGAGPTPRAGPEANTVNVYVSLQPRNETDPPQEWFVSPDTQLDVDVSGGGLSGTVTFEDLEPSVFEEPAPDPSVLESNRVSGTITWTCQE